MGSHGGVTLLPEAGSVASLGAFQEPNTAPVLDALTTRGPGRVHEITD